MSGRREEQRGPDLGKHEIHGETEAWYLWGLWGLGSGAHTQQRSKKLEKWSCPVRLHTQHVCTHMHTERHMQTHVYMNKHMLTHLLSHSHWLSQDRLALPPPHQAAHGICEGEEVHDGVCAVSSPAPCHSPRRGPDTRQTPSPAATLSLDQDFANTHTHPHTGVHPHARPTVLQAALRASERRRHSWECWDTPACVFTPRPGCRSRALTGQREPISALGQGTGQCSMHPRQGDLWTRPLPAAGPATAEHALACRRRRAPESCPHCGLSSWWSCLRLPKARSHVDTSHRKASGCIGLSPHQKPETQRDEANLPGALRDAGLGFPSPP